MAEPPETRVGQRRPGGRAARVRTSVLTAASDVLAEVGYDRLTIDEVATRAGVHRTTVYRRWPTKPELVADALGLYADEQIPIPDTGALVGDLQALGRAVAANLRSPVGIGHARSLVAGAAGSPELSERLNAFMDNRMAQSEPIVERAIERGEVAPGTDPRIVIEPIVGAIWFRVLQTGEPIDDGFVDRVVDLVAGGAGARA